MTSANASERVVVSPTGLRELVSEVFVALGSPRSHADCVAASLVAANLAGHDSHGVLLVPYYAEQVSRGELRPDATPQTVADRGSVVMLDGGFGLGQVGGAEAAALAIERGRRHGVACVLGRNFGHLGRLGEFTEAIADEGLATILLVNFQGAYQQVAPFGGSEARLTNNPISIAAPGDPYPLVADMALTAIADGKVRLAKARGELLRSGWVLDAVGRPATDPAALDAGGTLLPLGGLELGHKATALMVLVDVLAGALSDGGVCRADAGEFANAFLLIAVDVAPLQSSERYDAQVGALSSWVKSAARLPGVEQILLPGELERATAQIRGAEGIPVEVATWRALDDLAHSLGVQVPVP